MFRKILTPNYFGKDAIIKRLEYHKVDTIFGYGGGAILPLFDSLANSSISYYMNRNEQGSGHCAEGYAKITGKPGIVATTSGPGVTNLITPLQDSYSDGVPIIVLTGQVPTTAIGTDAFQECPAIDLTKPCTKWNYQLTSSNEIDDVIDEAFYIALSGRPGPIHIDIPKDILMQAMVLNDSIPYHNDNKLIDNKWSHISKNTSNDNIDLSFMDTLLDIIDKSKKPIIIAGQGCNNCSDKLRQFAIQSNIPVTTTLHGMGTFDENHSLSLDMLGMHGAAYANFAIQDADLILSFGSRFDDNSVAGNEEAHRATFAYLFDDKLTKIKSSYGTGFRFPSLYEMYYVYAANSQSLEFVKSENSKSFDIGFEKNYIDYGLSLDLTYFNIEYENVLEGWKNNNSSGAAYTTQNADGVVKSQGLELMSGWRASDHLNFNLNYTYTSTYDGAEQDDPNKNQNYTNAQMVRVPRNIINLQTSYQSAKDKNLSFILNSKWSDMARDYGNGNRTFQDERIDDYFVNDLQINYKMWDSYNLFFNITNIFDEKYETVRDYSQLDRSFNIGLKSVY